MRPSVVRSWLLPLLSIALLVPACGEDDPPAAAPPKEEPKPEPLKEAVPGTSSFFSLAKHDTPETFYDLPYPSDLRLTAVGNPDLTGFPNPYPSVGITDIVKRAADRKGSRSSRWRGYGSLRRCPRWSTRTSSRRWLPRLCFCWSSIRLAACRAR